MLTMADIARLCGVSRQSVHAALNNKPGVSPETRERVLEIVRQHNYEPSRIATTLLGKSTDLVGLTILNIRNPFFADLVSGVNEKLREEGLHLLFFETPDKDEEVSAIKTLLSYQAAGVILSPVQDERRLDHLASLQGRGIPLITIGPVRGMETDYVEVENERVAELATEHLIRNGHKRIVYLEGPEKIVSARERTAGFIQALLINRLPFSEASVRAGGEAIESGFAAARDLLSQPKKSRPTAIACFNDLVAIGVYQAARELGLSIPGDVSVVGCDDIELARLLGPALTTISISSRGMGRAAAEMLVDRFRARINGNGNGHGHGGADGSTHDRIFLSRRFQPELIERQSVGGSGA